MPEITFEGGRQITENRAHQRLANTAAGTAGVPGRPRCAGSPTWILALAEKQ